jgi:TPR repeat protein
MGSYGVSPRLGRLGLTFALSVLLSACALPYAVALGYGAHCVKYGGPECGEDSGEELEGLKGFNPSNDWKAVCMMADNGDGRTRSAIGTYYRYGLRPFDLNPILAYKWYTLAMTSGYEPARSYRNKLAVHMTAEAVSDAGRLAHDWKVGDCVKEVTVASEI